MRQRQPRAAERILDVARDLFYREGIRAVGVDEIVRQAGVTKPSLYRSFPSKDELAASYLAAYEHGVLGALRRGGRGTSGRRRAKQIVAFLAGVGQRAVKPDYRGCGMTNAAVEYPEAGHPARLVGEANKRELRRRLRAMAAEMGAADPDTLGDGLLLADRGRLYQRPAVRRRRAGRFGRRECRPADRGEPADRSGGSRRSRLEWPSWLRASPQPVDDPVGHPLAARSVEREQFGKCRGKPLLDSRAHQPARPVQPRLHRFRLERQLVRRLLDAHLLDVAQDEHCPERVGKIIDGLFQELADLAAGKLGNPRPAASQGRKHDHCPSLGRGTDVQFCKFGGRPLTAHAPQRLVESDPREPG